MMTEEESRNRTCEERIEENYQGRMEQLRGMMALYGGQEHEPKEIIKILDDNGYPDWKQFTELVENELPWMAQRVFDENELQEIGQTLVSEFPLAVSVEGGAVKLELSWGGPQDYFMIYRNQSVYHFLDWFDGARRLVDYEDHHILYDLFGWLMEEHESCGGNRW